MHIAVPRFRVNISAVRRVDCGRFLVVAGLAALFAAVTVTKVQGLTPLFLPSDGAHYIADADSLLGEGVRELRHPPAFPMLIALVRPFVGEPNSFLWAMTISVALLVASLHTLLRRWLPFAPSLIGALAGSMIPIVGELFGWGGGATLLGCVMLILTLAAMESWIQRGGKRGFIVGAGLGVTALTHAFPFAVAAFAIVVRALALLVRRRRLGTGWDPLGWRGIASVAAVAVPAVLIAYPFYFGPTASLGGFRPSASWGLLMWALDDSLIILLLAIAAIVGIELSPHRGLVIYAACLSAIVLVFPAILEGHVTYANRVEYLVPIVSALGIGSLVAIARSRLPRTHWVGPAGLVSVVVLLGVVAFTAYLPKLATAVTYYNVWITPRDLPIFESLSSAEGTVATSWRVNDFSDGVLLSWFVEGLAKRPAFGPGDAFLANVPEQFEGGLDMQRLFAGVRGLENGALQVTASPPGSTADVSVQVRSAGFNYPFLIVRQTGSYPVKPDSVISRIDGERIVWTFFDAEGRTVMERIAWLDGETLTLRYALEPDADRGDWSIELVPTSRIGGSVTDVGGLSKLTQQPHRVDGVMDVRGEALSFVVKGAHADIEQIRDGRAQVILIQASDRSSLEIQIRVEASSEPETVRAFEQQALLERYAISNVLVLRDTDWMSRFNLDPCYVRSDQSQRMVVYAVRAVTCGGSV